MSINSIERKMVKTLGFDYPYDEGFIMAQICTYIELASRILRISPEIVMTVFAEQILMNADSKTLQTSAYSEILWFFIVRNAWYFYHKEKDVGQILIKAFDKSVKKAMFVLKDREAAMHAVTPFLIGFGILTSEHSSNTKLRKAGEKETSAFLELMEKIDRNSPACGIVLVKFLNNIPTQVQKIPMVKELGTLNSIVNLVDVKRLNVMLEILFESDNTNINSSRLTTAMYEKGLARLPGFRGTGLALWTATRVENEFDTEETEFNPKFLLELPKPKAAWPHQLSIQGTTAEPVFC